MQSVKYQLRSTHHLKRIDDSLFSSTKLPFLLLALLWEQYKLHCTAPGAALLALIVPGDPEKLITSKSGMLQPLSLAA